MHHKLLTMYSLCKVFNEDKNFAQSFNFVLTEQVKMSTIKVRFLLPIKSYLVCVLSRNIYSIFPSILYFICHLKSSLVNCLKCNT